MEGADASRGAGTAVRSGVSLLHAALLALLMALLQGAPGSWAAEAEAATSSEAAPRAEVEAEADAGGETAFEAGVEADPEAVAEGEVDVEADPEAEPADEVLPTVSDLDFEGVDAVPEDDLREAILTTAPTWRFWLPAPVFDEDDLREDLDRIVALYRDHGYYEATASYQLDWNRNASKVDVTIQVVEGEPLHLVEWSLELAEGPPLDPERVLALRNGLPRPGSIFGADAYRAARSALLESVAELGHPAPRLEGAADVDLSARTANVAWVLHLGPPVFFGAITITGLVDVETKVVERELRVRPGEPYSIKALRRSEKRIFDTGLFRSVAVQPRIPKPPEGAPPGTDDETTPVVWPLEVRLVERTPRNVRVGVGFGTEDLFRVKATWTHRNFLGGGRRLSLGGKYSDLIGGLDLTFSEPYVFDWPTRFELRLAAVRETPRAYTAIRYSGVAEFEVPLGWGFKGRIGHGLEYADVTNQRLDVAGVDLPDTTRLSTLPAGLQRSTLDDRIEPTRGTWLDLSIEPALGAIGSEVDYVKLGADARGFVPLGPVVLALRAHFATLQPLLSSGQTDIPKFKRFYSGGSTSVRGFKYQKLGLRDSEGNPVGGLSLGEASVELRFPIYRWISGVVFSDAGDLQLKPFDWSPADVYYSSGVGLRAKTPIGPLRVDVARLYNPPSGVSRYAFYFAVGHAF